MPRRPSKKDTPAKLAGRMKRRWRVVEILGTVEAPDVEAAKAAAAVQFDLDEVRSGQGWEERWAGDAMARAGALAADDRVRGAGP